MRVLLLLLLSLFFGAVSSHGTFWYKGEYHKLIQKEFENRDVLLMPLYEGMKERAQWKSVHTTSDKYSHLVVQTIFKKSGYNVSLIGNPQSTGNPQKDAFMNAMYIPADTDLHIDVLLVDHEWIRDLIEHPEESVTTSSYSDPDYPILTLAALRYKFRKEILADVLKYRDQVLQAIEEGVKAKIGCIPVDTDISQFERMILEAMFHERPDYRLLFDYSHVDETNPETHWYIGRRHITNPYVCVFDPLWVPKPATPEPEPIQNTGEKTFHSMEEVMAYLNQNFRYETKATPCIDVLSG